MLGYTAVLPPAIRVQSCKGVALGWDGQTMTETGPSQSLLYRNDMCVASQ